MRELLLASVLFTTTAQAQEGPGVTVEGLSIEEQGATDRQGSNGDISQFSIPVRIVDDPAEAERNRRRQEKADANQEADLVEQRRAADAATRSAVSAEWQSVFALPQIFISLLGTIAVSAAVWIAVNSNSIARDTARRQLRAYLAFKAVEIKREDPGSVWAEIENAGQTPAYSVSIVSKCVVPGEEIESTVEFGPVGPQSSRLHRFALKASIGPSDRRFLDPFAEFTLRYRDAFGLTWKATYAFHLNLKDRSNSEVLVLYPRAGTKDEYEVKG